MLWREFDWLAQLGPCVHLWSNHPEAAVWVMGHIKLKKEARQWLAEETSFCLHIWVEAEVGQHELWRATKFFSLGRDFHSSWSSSVWYVVGTKTNDYYMEQILKRRNVFRHTPSLYSSSQHRYTAQPLHWCHPQN